MDSLLQRNCNKSSMKDATASYYDVLGVSETADLKVIKDAYHKASLKLHPDKNTVQKKNNNTTDEGNNANDFERVKTAWECLRDKDSRRRYDQERTIQSQSTKGRKASAIILSTADCHPFTLENNEKDGTTSTVVVLAFTCRCGMELDTTNPPPPEDDDGEEEEEYDDDGLMDCPGCSLVYDTTRVGE
jgi:curved DNA-binding protein CbpA